MKKIFALLMAAVMTMSLLAGCGQKDEDNNTSSDDNTAGDSQYHIGFVVHTTSGDVMAAIEYGAKAAAEDYGVKLTYTGPADSDNTQQISMFESLVAAGCDAIVIIAGDSTVWDEPIAAAVEKGVTDGRTFTHVRRLDRAQRRQELARLTGGAHITPTMLEGAEELLSAAEDFKRTLE